MIDTHAHLDFPQFDQDREEVISRSFDSGVRAIINVGVDLERSRKSVEIAKRRENIFASVGLHPDFFTRGDLANRGNWGDQIEELQELAKHEKVVAIGECGLDYYRIKKPDFSRGNPVSAGEIKENQKRGFLAQIEIARELNLPVIVHCRDVYPVASGKTPEWFGAWEDLYEIISSFLRSNLKNTKNIKSDIFQSPAFPFPRFHRGNSSKPDFTGIPQGRTFFVLHCYSGEKKDTEKFLKLPNVYFSFSGNITYPKPVERAEKLAEAVRMIPLDKIMLDSDSPFLAPQEFRGKRNEPIFIKYIAKKIAEIKEINEGEVEKITDENARKFFGI